MYNNKVLTDIPVGRRARLEASGGRAASCSCAGGGEAAPPASCRSGSDLRTGRGAETPTSGARRAAAGAASGRGWWLR